MSPEERDKAYLWDILDAARQIDASIPGVTLTAYEEDRK